MKTPNKVTLSVEEATLSSGCIQYYLLSRLGPKGLERSIELYGERLTKAVLRAIKKKPGPDDKELAALARFYARLYKQVTPMNMNHPVTRKPCSLHQWIEAATK